MEVIWFKLRWHECYRPYARVGKNGSGSSRLNIKTKWPVHNMAPVLNEKRFHLLPFLSLWRHGHTVCSGTGRMLTLAPKGRKNNKNEKEKKRGSLLTNWKRSDVSFFGESNQNTFFRLLWRQPRRHRPMGVNGACATWS